MKCSWKRVAWLGLRRLAGQGRQCSSALPTKRNEAGVPCLAGLLTCASSSGWNGLPRSPQWLALRRVPALSAYSYGVATDLHRLPDTSQF